MDRSSWVRVSKVAAVVVVIAAVGFLTFLGTRGGSGDGDDGGVTVSVAPTEPDREGYAKTDKSRADYLSVKDSQAMLKTAAVFANTVVPNSPDRVDGWAERVGSLSTPKLKGYLGSVDSRSVPVGSLQDSPSVLEYGDNYATISATYLVEGGSQLEVRFMVVHTDNGWKVNSYQTE